MKNLPRPYATHINLYTAANSPFAITDQVGFWSSLRVLGTQEESRTLKILILNQTRMPIPSLEHLLNKMARFELTPPILPRKGVLPIIPHFI